MQTTIQSLISHHISFALYRLPDEMDFKFVIQSKDSPEYISQYEDLENKSGFVLAPFKINANTPIVLIRPDLQGCGEQSIKEICKKLNNISIESSNQTINSNIKATNYELYDRSFTLFFDALKKRYFKKLVLSRTLQVQLSETFSLWNSFCKACSEYPHMMIYLCYTPKTSIWLGCTPEILLTQQKNLCRTVALAGTMPLSNNDWSKKNQEEQYIVSQYIKQRLNSLNITFEKKGPYTFAAGHLAHLRTDFIFQIAQEQNIGNLISILHPTPAVCGLPKEDALNFIVTNEGYDRSYYSGFIGWISPCKVSLFVNLRCAMINKNIATLFAGGGILPDSTVNMEWEETEQKLKTIRNIID